jgi:hypothetical protein
MRLKHTLCLACLSLAFLPAAASAHDSNLARWDIEARGEELVLVLRTSQHALHQSLAATSPEVEQSSYDPDAYRDLLGRLLRSVVRPEEDGAALPARAIDIQLGHESVITMTFSRQRGGPPSSLRVDLRGFSSRPNQHHLIYVHTTGGRERVMLRPIDEHLLRWSAASGFTRALAGETR